MGQKVLAICLAVFTVEAEVHEAESDGGRGEVGEEGDVPQQLFLGRGPGDQGEDAGAGRTPGPEQGADVVIIAGEVHQEAGGLVPDVLGSSVLGLRSEKILQKTWKKRVEMMVPVRKHCQVCECQ